MRTWKLTPAALAILALVGAVLVHAGGINYGSGNTGGGTTAGSVTHGVLSFTPGVLLVGYNDVAVGITNGLTEPVIPLTNAGTLDCIVCDAVCWSTNNLGKQIYFKCITTNAAANTGYVRSGAPDNTTAFTNANTNPTLFDNSSGVALTIRAPTNSYGQV